MEIQIFSDGQFVSNEKYIAKFCYAESLSGLDKAFMKVF